MDHYSLNVSPNFYGFHGFIFNMLMAFLSVQTSGISLKNSVLIFLYNVSIVFVSLIKETADLSLDVC